MRSAVWPSRMLLAASFFLASCPLLGDVITIVVPSQAEVINAGTLVIAEVDLAIARDSIQSVTFQSSPDATVWTDIPGQCPKGLAEFCTLWNPWQFGVQYVRAVLVETGGRITPSMPVYVLVNRHPVPVAVASP